MQPYRIRSTNMAAPPVDVEAASVAEALDVAARRGLVEAELLKDGKYQCSVRRLRPDCEYWIVAGRKPRTSQNEPRGLSGLFSSLWRLTTS